MGKQNVERRSDGVRPWSGLLFFLLSSTFLTSLVYLAQCVRSMKDMFGFVGES